MDEIPPWDRLAAAAARAAARGDWVNAVKLGSSAREAWLNHCAAVDAKEQARSRIPLHSVWTRDEERER